jgi:hypothetical protein
MDERGVDEAAFAGLVARLAQAGVDSIYQPFLRTDEVFDLYAEVDRHVSVPLCVYENPDSRNRPTCRARCAVSTQPAIGARADPHDPRIAYMTAGLPQLTRTKEDEPCAR